MASTTQPIIEATDTELAETAECASPVDDRCEWFDRVVSFQLADQCYALPISRVQEIQQIVAFAEVPSDEGGVVGMVNLRGTIIPAVDMRALLGLESRERSLDTPMVIGRSDAGLVALIVDHVDDVVELPMSCLQEPPALHSLSSRMLGVARLGDGLAYVLDLDLVVNGSIMAGVA